MTPEFRQMVIDGDELAIEQAYFNGKCPHFFVVDWREDDADIVQYCAACLGLTSLTADLKGEELFVTFEGRETKVPLLIDIGDRHITICTLNDMINPNYEIRMLVVSLGTDSYGLAALSLADWAILEEGNAVVVAENFIDPRKLPNTMTELTDETLPEPARARYHRLVERHKAH